MQPLLWCEAPCLFASNFGVAAFYTAETGQKLLTHREAEQARLQAEQARLQAEERASQEAALRQAAEARLAELEAQLRAFQARRFPEAP